ncbi:MAG: hypothetical protein JW940_04560 [Polyangiaceae bacterium]|nr:hypothetical protein [Polyangiaceae bacterium]
MRSLLFLIRVAFLGLAAVIATNLLVASAMALPASSDGGPAERTASTGADKAEKPPDAGAADARAADARPADAAVADAAVADVTAANATAANARAANARAANATAANARAAAHAATDAGATDAEAVDAAAADPEITALRLTAQRIRDLINGSLDLTVDPATLFDIALDDEQVVVAEAKRVLAVLEAADRETEPTRPDHARRPTARRPKPRRDAGVDAAAGDAGPDAGRVTLDPEFWQARVELDRARLGFYDLSRTRRDELLAHHAERQREAERARSQAKVTDAERRAREAAQKHREALEAAARARTEAERAVGEEYARLLGVSGAQAAYEAHLARASERLQQRGERTLTFERRVRGAQDAHAPPDEVDALYDELRRWLRASRDQLAAALADLTSGQSRVPEPGPDRLAALSVQVERANVDALRPKVAAAAASLRNAERAFREKRASQLNRQVRVLNTNRLALLPRLSRSKSNAITGFGAIGLDQAAAELRQVTLTLRYHFELTQRWLASVRSAGGTRNKSAVFAAVLLAKLLLALVVFLWLRSRLGAALLRWQEAAHEELRARADARPSALLATLTFVNRVHRPLEWLLLVWLLLWLLPGEAQNVLEVNIATTILTWSLVGSLSVAVIDAIAGRTSELGESAEVRETARLRLRSLRMVGRTVVLFALILAFSNRLVGRGTLYNWVFSTCWFASLPLMLVLVSWWRTEIFERIAHVRKKRGFELWVLRNQTGYASFFAALVAGTQLFLSGIVRAVRGWVGRFDVTRRLLAYLFRRGLDRLAEDRGEAGLLPLPEPLFKKLGPGTASVETVASRGDEKVRAVIERINAVGGGVFAVVGGRGAGKTTVLDRVRDTRADVVLLDTPFGSLEALRAELARNAGTDPEATLEEAASLLNSPERDVGLLIDNAHRLIQPVMGGLRAFDQLASVARHHCSTCSWVFALDDVVWRFFERARGARPMFDDVVVIEPWREEQIASLLRMRSRQAGVDPSFRLLSEPLPSDADDVDRAEADERTAAGFYRLLWDYAGGNPGVALHMWRRSLGVAEDGTVCVRVFQAPDARDLEELPDSAVFVLRAVIQLDQASPGDLATATLLKESQVEDVLRYGLARGYFERLGDRYRVTWAWFRPIIRFLQRRHLLAGAR